MNEHDLERELSALQPQKPSADLKSRIAAQLSGPPLPELPRASAARIWQLSLALSIALLALIVAGRWLHQSTAKLRSVNVPTIEMTVALDPSLPTVWNLHQAATVSPNQLDALLDRYSPSQHAGVVQPAPAAAFSILTSTNNSRLGEL